MGRATRWAWNGLAAGSLLAGLATGVLWWRSTVAGGDQFIATTGHRLWWVMSSDGQFDVLTVGDWPAGERPRWLSGNASNDQIPTVSHPGSWAEWSHFGVVVEHDLVQTQVDPTGRPVSLAESEATPGAGAPAMGVRSVLPYHSVRAPYWLAVVLAAAVPALAAVWWRLGWGGRRRAAGSCPSCGYDLRATPGRCPECGAEPAAATKGDA